MHYNGLSTANTDVQVEELTLELDGVEEALGTNNETATTGSNAGALNAMLRQLKNLFNASLNQTAKATGVTVALATDDSVAGATNETAPATDTATAGLNGRLQRIAQRLTTMMAGGTAGKTASATFTPANTSHTAGDCVGAAAELALGAPSASLFRITSVSLLINTGTAEATGWSVKLYTITPPSATADDAPWDLPSGDQASFLGEIALPTAVDKGSTLWIETHSVNKDVQLAGTSVFAYLTNDTTATLAAVAHTLKIGGVPL